MMERIQNGIQKARSISQTLLLATLVFALVLLCAGLLAGMVSGQTQDSGTASISGSISVYDGTSISEVESIEIHSTTDGVDYYEQISSSDGSYSFDDIPAATYTIVAEQRGLEDRLGYNCYTDRIQVTVSEGGSVTSDLELIEGVCDLQIQNEDPSGSISGTVETFETGDSVSDASVTLTRVDDGTNYSDSVSTDADGSYSITGLPAGDYVLEYKKSGGSEESYDCLYTKERVTVEYDEVVVDTEVVESTSCSTEPSYSISSGWDSASVDVQTAESPSLNITTIVDGERVPADVVVASSWDAFSYEDRTQIEEENYPFARVGEYTVNVSTVVDGEKYTGSTIISSHDQDEQKSLQFNFGESSEGTDSQIVNPGGSDDEGLPLVPLLVAGILGLLLLVGSIVGIRRGGRL